GLQFLLPWSLFLPLIVYRYKSCQGTILMMAVVMIALSVVPQRKTDYLIPWYPFAVLAVSTVICQPQSGALFRRCSDGLVLTALIIAPFVVGFCVPWLRSKGVNYKREFAERVLQNVTDGSCVIGNADADDIALLNYLHRQTTSHWRC